MLTGILRPWLQRGQSACEMRKMLLPGHLPFPMLLCIPSVLPLRVRLNFVVSELSVWYSACKHRVAALASPLTALTTLYTSVTVISRDHV